MSQQIDNQIVKMQFDNVSFEKNVQQSMSTLDKLKQALKFDKVNMSPLQDSLDNINVDKVSTACDKVTQKFSLLGTIGDQIIRDLTTKFTNAAEKMVKSFSIDQIASGWEKYAQKTTAVQTIMANTVGEVGEGLKWKDQAEQMEAITKEIEKLNWFTDETSYSLTDMTANIGKFVAQKVPLEQATRAMMGISAWAAISGQTKTQAEMAMYNLSQSLGQGAVKAIDWKSIENANMATSEFKETVIETAKALGVLDKETGVINDAFITASKYNGPDYVDVKNFRDTLSAGWFNSDVLMESLEKYGGFSEKINELYNVVNREGMVSTTSGLLKTLELVKNGSADADKEITRLAKSASMETKDLKELFSELAGDEYDLGRRAFAAAQEAKTFQEAIDATSDAVASEWMGIFEAIFGNYLEAKELWTDLANSLWDIFAAPLDNIKWALIEWKDTEVEVFDETTGKYKQMKGREILLDAVATALRNIGDAIEVIRSALAEVFPIFNLFVTEGEDAFDTSEGAQGVLAFTLRLRDFAQSLKLSEESASALHTIVVLLATAIKTAFTIVGTAIKGLSMLIGPIFNILDAVFGLIGKIITAITGNDSVNEFNNKLAAGGDKIKSRYLWVMEKVAQFLNKVADAIRGLPESKTIQKIGEGFRNAKKDIEDFWEAFTQMPIIQQMVTDFNNTIDAIGKKITPVIDSVKKSMDGLGKSMQSKMNLQTLNAGLTVVYNKINAFITLVKGFAERVKLFFTNLKEGKSVVESFRTSFGDIVDKIRDLKKNLFDFFDNLFSKGDEIGERFNLKEVQQAIHDFVTNITPDQVTMIAVATAFGLIALNMLRLSDAMRNAVEAFTGVGMALKNVINSYVKKQKSTILQVAEAIVIVAASLWVLSKIPQADLDRAVGALIRIGLVLGGLVAVMALAGAALEQWGGKRSLVELATGLVLASGALMVAVLSLKALEYVKLEGVIPKIITLGVIMAGLVGLSVLMGKMDKFSKGSITLLAVSGALLLCSTALAKIADVPAAKMEKSLDSVLKMMAALAAITFAAGNVGIFSAVGLIAVVMTLSKILPMIEDMVNYDYTKIQTGLKKNEEIVKKLGLVVGAMVIIGAIAGNRLKGAGIAMLSLAGTFAALLGIAKLASMMRPTDLAKGEKFMWSMAGMLAVLELFSSKSRLGMFGGKNGGEGTKAFTRIAVAMGIMLGIAKLASMMEWKDLAKGAVALGGLTLLVLAMVEVAKHAEKASGTIKSVAGIIFAISFILAEVAVLAMIPMENMKPALVAVLSIIGMLGLFAYAISKNTRIFDKASMKATSWIPIVASMAMVVAMGSMLAALAKQPVDGIAAAGAAMVSVIGAMAIVAKALSSASGGHNNISPVFLIETMIMFYFVYMVLSKLTSYMKNENIDGNTMLKAAASIALVVAAITPALAILSKIKDNNWKGVGTNVLGAFFLLASVATAIGLLSNLGNPDTMVNTAVSIAIGMAAMFVPIAVLGAVGELCNKVSIKSVATTTIAALVILAGVATAIGLLSNFGNPDAIIKSAQAISLAMLAISVPIAVIGVIGQFCKTANPGVMITAVGGAVLALAGIAGVLYLFANKIDVGALVALNDAIPILATCLIGVAGLAVAISTAGLIAGGQAAIVGAGFLAINAALIALAEIIVAVGILGQVISENPIFGWRILDGLDMLIQIAGKVGDAIGAFIGGVAAGATKRLEEVGDNLTKFSEKLVPFSENMSKISSEAVTGAKNVAAAMLYLTAAEFLEGIGKFLKLGKTRSIDFAPLGRAIAGFCDAIKDIPNDAVAKGNLCALIAEKLSKITKNFDLKGGFMNKLFGEKESLAKFAMNIKIFGKAMADFCEAIEDLPENAIELAQRAADAATPMIEFSKTLLADGGLIQSIIGHKDLGVFGENLTTFVTSLTGFVVSLSALEKYAPNYAELIKNCADATIPMVDLASGIENSGGVLAGWLGEDTLDVFGKTLEPFAKGLKEFVKIIAKMAKDTPDYKQIIIDTAEAATHLVTLANNLEPMSGPLKRIFKDDTLAGFGKTLSAFGEGLASYAKSLVEVDLDLISNANAAVTELVQLGALASGVRADSFSGLKLALEQISEIPVTMIANEIAVGTPLLHTNLVAMFDDILLLLQNRMVLDGVTYRLYGRELVWNIGQGILRNMHLIYVALNTMVNNIKNYLDGAMSQDKFYQYGANVAIGVANGIRDHIGDAVGAASAMAAAVGAIIPTVLLEHSPSRLTYKHGAFVSIGLANGIRDYTSVAVGAASNMSEQVIEAANNVVTEIAKVLDSDMDTQPVIRPVLDMSDVTSKAGKIGAIFNAKDLKLAYGISGTMKSVAPANATVIANAQNKAGSSVGNTINFTQNNYSPKELSRVEIYRQTQNQLSMMKGVVKANV